MACMSLTRDMALFQMPSATFSGTDVPAKATLCETGKKFNNCQVRMMGDGGLHGDDQSCQDISHFTVHRK